MTLRIATLNIWSTHEWDSRAASIVAWMRELQPDLLAMQEVSRTAELDQAGWLGEQLGMTARFGASFDRKGRQFGNALLSRLPVTDERVLQLPLGDGEREPRSLLSVEVTAAAGAMWCSATHLSHLAAESWVRALQVEAIAEWLDGLGGDLPPVLCGDFNATPETAEVGYLTDRYVDAWGASHRFRGGATFDGRNPHVSSRRPGNRIDYILVAQPAGAPARVRSASIVCDEPRAGAWPSDHFGVLAEID